MVIRTASERSELRAKRAAHEVSEAVLYLQNTFVCKEVVQIRTSHKQTCPFFGPNETKLGMEAFFFDNAHKRTAVFFLKSAIW